MRNDKTENGTSDGLNRIADQFSSKIESGNENFKGKIDHYAGIGMAGAEAARDSLSHLTENIGHRVEHAVEQGLDRLKSSSADARAIVKKYPLYTVAGVVAVSFVAGMIYGKTSSRR